MNQLFVPSASLAVDKEATLFIFELRAPVNSHRLLLYAQVFKVYIWS